MRIAATTGCGNELRDLLNQVNDGRVGKPLEAPGRVHALELQLCELASDSSPAWIGVLAPVTQTR